MKKQIIYLILALGISYNLYSQSIIDVRDIRPDVVLLLDTSGSMEWKHDNYTYPNCTGQYRPNSPDEKNRWIDIVEILTGTFNNYACRVERRDDPRRIDYGYFIPHFRPICVGYYHEGDPLPYSDPNCQQQDGLLDLYRVKIKFGLMTFDSNPDPSENIQGMWSYGPTKDFQNGNCSYRWNVGAKRYEQTNYPNRCVLDRGSADIFRQYYGQELGHDIEGELISVGYEGNNMDVGYLLDLINTWLQYEILSIRPFWATPLSAMLDDAEYYFAHHVDVRPINEGGCDCYFECRKRFVILLTDGMPNMDGRPRCTLGVNCPYDFPENEAGDLWQGSTEHGRLVANIPVFVVGFNITQAEQNDPLGRTPAQLLNDIAREGGTCCRFDRTTGQNIECGIDCDPETENNCRCALFAEDRTTLRSVLSQVLDYISGQATTHTRTATTTQITNLALACEGQTCPVQYQFNTSLTIQSGSDPNTNRTLPWIGNLERTSYICRDDGQGNLSLSEWRLDNYGEILNGQNDRYLYTLLPTRPSRVIDNNNNEIRPDSISQITPEMLGLNKTQNSLRDEIIAWMVGTHPVRSNAKLGAIYHSNPTIIGPPDKDLAIQSYYAGPHRIRGRQYNEGFRTRYSQRPNILYINTLDGILHAFEVEGNPPEHPRELWGYIPGMLLKKLPQNLQGNQFLLDGSPVVKDVRLWKSSSTGTADEWATVLVSALRQGGGVRGYFALDVTDMQDGRNNPQDPGFRILWEITNNIQGFEELGLSYPDPLIGTVFIRDPDRNNTVGEVAVAILPGGYWVDPQGNQNQGGGHGGGNTNNAGNAVYVVKLENGRLLRKLTPPPQYSRDTQFTGSPFGYNILTGTITTKVFIGDNQGRIWRIDLSDQNPDNWTMTLFYDLFADGLSKQPIYLAPVGSLTQSGELVLIVATGDTDNLASHGINKIVSLTEKITYDSQGKVTDVHAVVNWEIAFGLTEINRNIIGVNGEKVTGQPVIFNDVVYFTTFVPTGDPNNCCSLGYGRVWGIHYTGHNPNSITDIEPMFDENPDDPNDRPVMYIDLLDRNGRRENTIAFGPAIIKRASCAQEQQAVDEFGQPIIRLINVTPPEYELVVQINAPGERAEIGGKERVTQTLTRKLSTPSPVVVADSWATIFGF